MWYFYILKSQDKFYIGISKNLKKRLRQHQNKESYYTKRFDKFELAYTEQFLARKEAENREKQVKGWSRAKKQALIAKDFLELKKLSINSGLGKG